MSEYEALCWWLAASTLPLAGGRLLAALHEIVLVCRRKPLSQEYFSDAAMSGRFLFYPPAVVLLQAVCTTEYAISDWLRFAGILTCATGAACDMIRGVVLRHREWREWYLKAIHRMFTFFESLRAEADICAKWVKRLIGIAFLFALVAAYLDPSSEAIVILAAVILALLLLWSVLKQRRSCRELLLIWFGGGCTFCAVVRVGLCLVTGDPHTEQPIFGYILYTGVFTAFWCISIGVADDDAGKLAALAVNTATTLLSVSTSLIVLYGQQRYPDYEETWSWLQFGVIYGLLPLVASGYIAALFKEAQIYWRGKYGAGQKE